MEIVEIEIEICCERSKNVAPIYDGTAVPYGEE